jgi:hypothetical protein
LGEENKKKFLMKVLVQGEIIIKMQIWVEVIENFSSQELLSQNSSERGETIFI